MQNLAVAVMALAVIGAMCYIPAGKDHFLTDALLREVVDRMGKDLADAADVYLDFPDANRLALNNMMPGRATKDIENEEQQFPMDYESSNPNPSTRDQEYLQHSSLWGHQYVTVARKDRWSDLGPDYEGGAGEGKQRLKPDGTMANQNEVKSDATLPAYCNPPNPCPVGYSAGDGCLEHFENTAAFSREYQAAQDCMCDSEHMFDCPATIGRELLSPSSTSDLSDSELDRIIEQFQVEDQHKSLVAKKFHAKKSINPYLKGERLPVAAKKGTNVVS